MIESRNKTVHNNICKILKIYFIAGFMCFLLFCDVQFDNIHAFGDYKKGWALVEKGIRLDLLIIKERLRLRLNESIRIIIEALNKINECAKK